MWTRELQVLRATFFRNMKSAKRKIEIAGWGTIEGTAWGTCRMFDIVTLRVSLRVHLTTVAMIGGGQ